MSDAIAQLPKYRCHKEVYALQIAAITTVFGNHGLPSRKRQLVFVRSAYAPIEVDTDWITKHQPSPLGYYVVDQDGSTSYSPKDAFEQGYTLVRT
jgi:hypothetical protein